MESYEKRSDQAESQAERLEEESERVGRRIEETKSDWQSKQGQVPGMEPEAEADFVEAADDDSGEAADDDEEPDTTTAD